MRLWHQSFAQLDKLPGYTAAIREHLDKVAAPGTEIVMHGMLPGTHTTMQPGKDIGYSYVQHMHSLQFLDSVSDAFGSGVGDDDGATATAATAAAAAAAGDCASMFDEFASIEAEMRAMRDF